MPSWAYSSFETCMQFTRLNLPWWSDNLFAEPVFRGGPNDGTVPLFVTDPLVIQVHGIVVQQLFEFRGRYLVGGQVASCSRHPCVFDSAGHYPILYSNVYTFRIGSGPQEVRAPLTHRIPGMVPLAI